MREAAIYVRQSVSRADSVSLETQERLCRMDLPPDLPVRVYRDAGYSGKNTQRPALHEMMTAVEAGELSCIYVYKLDRISRNLADFTELLRICQRNGVTFQSHTERFESASPMGQAMQSLLMVFAQLERETICGRVRDTAFARAKLGFDTGGDAPIGFRKVSVLLAGKQTQMLEPTADAPIITDGFSRYLQADGSLSALARHWNALPLRTGRGNLWSSATVARILRNPVYVQANAPVYAYLASLGAILCTPEPLPPNHGVYLYADRRTNHSKLTDLHDVYAICAPHLGLVEAELWLSCQQKLTASRQKRNTGKGTTSWLSGLLYCAQCQSTATIVQGRHAQYLVCGGKKRGICTGLGATWRLDTVEPIFAQLLTDRLRYLSAIPITPTGSAPVQQHLDTLRLRRERLLQLLTDTDTEDLAGIAEAIQRLDSRIAELSTQCHTERQTHSLPLPDWNTCTFPQKKTIAQQLIRCAMVEGQTIAVYWNG